VTASLTHVRHRLGLLAGTAAGLLAAVPAQAQEVPLPDLPPLQQTVYVPDARGKGDVDMDVRTRHRPEFDATGFPLGIWRFFPSVAADIGYESNPFGDARNPDSAAFAALRPAMALNATPSWGQLAFGASGRFVRFLNQAQANENSYTVNGYGRYDLTGDTHLEAGANFGQRIERRDSSGFPDGRVQPVRYIQSQVFARATHQSGDLRIMGAVDYTGFNFRDTKALTSTGAVAGIIDQDLRDQHILRGTLRGDFSVTPDMAVFVQGIAQSVDYRVANIAPGVPNLGGKAYTALAGVSFAGNRLLRGSIGVGYVWRQFGRGGGADTNGLAVKADVAFFATPLLTVSAKASRSVEEAVLRDTSGYISTAFSIGADYEVKRWLIVRAGAGYRYDNFRTNPRNDKVFDANVGATYNVDRHIAFEGRATFVSRKVDNDPFAASYDDASVSLGVRYSF